jgi:basic amino acid/polyamine antiporter, APA family
MTTLARKLHLTDYFTLAFGTMVGVGWLVVMDDWLGRGGPLGGVLGFAIGGAALVPIGYVYGRLVAAIPDAGSEIAYTGRVFGRGASFAAGWTMILAYWIVCPWEAVAMGRIAAYIFPALDSFELYRIGGQPVYLWHLVIGLGLTGLITALNYRGIRSSATFQNWATFTLLALFVLFAACAARRGSSANLRPLFHGAAVVSVLQVLQIVPYFMTGFESVPKCAEEAEAGFRAQDFARAILLALGVGATFYASVILVVAYVHPWRLLLHQNFATAVAFQQAFHARWIVNIILGAALISLLKVFNGNFVASSRLLFALGRRGLIHSSLGEVHARNQTPYVAAIWIGLASAVAACLGEAILVPITEVGSMASAVGWFAACAAYYRIEVDGGRRRVAVLGALVALAMVLMKALPFVPGHFSRAECVALGLWVLLGVLLWRTWRRKAVGRRR